MLYPINSMYYRQFLQSAGKKAKYQQAQPQSQVIGNKGQQGEHPAAQSA